MATGLFMSVLNKNQSDSSFERTKNTLSTAMLLRASLSIDASVLVFTTFLATLEFVRFKLKMFENFVFSFSSFQKGFICNTTFGFIFLIYLENIKTTLWSDSINKFFTFFFSISMRVATFKTNSVSFDVFETEHSMNVYTTWYMTKYTYVIE